jgi:hypothetical protein
LEPEQASGTNLYGDRDKNLIRIVTWITSVIASLLPVLSIVCLYYVKSMGARLAIIAGFNAILTLSIMWFAGPKRIDLFAAVAA